MSNLTHDFQFQGTYRAMPVQVEGYFYHIPKGASGSPSPDRELLSIHFRLQKLQEPKYPSINPTFHVFIFLGAPHTRIGELVDNNPELYKDPFFIRLKVKITGAYINLLREKIKRIKG
jgi:hypothetical protein